MGAFGQVEAATKITQAQAQILPTNGAAYQGLTKLPHRWDSKLSRFDGQAEYRVTLPPSEGDDLYGLLIYRIGNQARVSVNGTLIQQLGELGRPTTDSAKAPLLLSVPNKLLSRSSPNVLHIEISVQAARWGGLSSMQFGLLSELKPLFDQNWRWRQTASAAICVAFSVLGLMAGLLWLKQRDLLFGLFFMTAVFGLIRMGDRLLVSPPLAWPLWGYVVAVSFYFFGLHACRFALVAIGESSNWVKKGYRLYLAIGFIGPAIAFFLKLSLAWTVTLGLFIVPAAFTFIAILRATLKQRTTESVLLLLAMLMLFATGIRDFLVVRLSESGVDTFSVMPHALFGFVLFMAWILVERYIRQNHKIIELNAGLESRVQERELELAQSYQQLKRKDEQETILLERQRIMREIHDGVGSQLVGLLNLLNKDGVPRAQLLEQATSVLDEMRIAVDSLQPVEGDIATVLATLRYRLQPRLSASGLDVQWNIGSLPSVPDLTPTRVWQIQRIILEAFTNVIKHSNATRIEVIARQVNGGLGGLEFVVSDNGQGCAVLSDNEDGLAVQNKDAHHGVKNMRARAGAIGARLSIESRPGAGTTVRVVL